MSTEDDLILRHLRPPKAVDVFEEERDEDDLEDEEEEPEPWERLGRVYLLRGRDVELFPIGAMAEALHRRPPTIRSWEDKGWFPKTPIRGAVQGRNGKRRLYTRRMIEGTVRIAQEEGILKDPRQAPDMNTTNFPERIHEFFENLEIR